MDRERYWAQFAEFTSLPPWFRDGACVGLDPAVMVPEAHDRKGFERAKAICSTCPIETPCLEYALASDVQGIWGGTSWRDRQDIRRARRRGQVGALVAVRGITG